MERNSSIKFVVNPLDGFLERGSYREVMNDGRTDGRHPRHSVSFTEIKRLHESVNNLPTQTVPGPLVSRCRVQTLYILFTPSRGNNHPSPHASSTAGGGFVSKRKYICWWQVKTITQIRSPTLITQLNFTLMHTTMTTAVSIACLLALPFAAASGDLGEQRNPLSLLKGRTLSNIIS